MRSSGSRFTAVLIALLVNVVLCSDMEACRRCCFRRSTVACDGIPCWVRCIKVDKTDSFQCPTGTKCYCCHDGSLIDCDGSCDAGTFCCIKPNHPIPSCPGQTYPKPITTAPGGVHILYAMICDRSTYMLRFACPCEEEDGYFSLCFHGQKCHDPVK
jgi:hypothetical protein